MGVGDGVQGSCGCCRGTGEVHGKVVMGASKCTENGVMAGRAKNGVSRTLGEGAGGLELLGFFFFFGVSSLSKPRIWKCITIVRENSIYEFNMYHQLCLRPQTTFPKTHSMCHDVSISILFPPFLSFFLFPRSHSNPRKFNK